MTTAVLVLPKRYFTYIVRCFDNTFYTGKTDDLEKRVAQHNGTLSGGAKYTRIRRPVVLVYFEEQPSNLHACRREEQIKNMSRKQKERLIAAHNSS